MLVFRLWNADTEQIIPGVFKNDSTFCISSTVEYNIEAVASACTKKVDLKLKYQGRTVFTSTERVAPYFLHGDTDSGINGRERNEGSYEISAYPDGDTSKTLTVNFNLKYC